LLSAKLADEERALDLCRTKARQKKLPMEVIDAEFQW
jgi:cell fate regulator YaaT (PSP1 superfamily)